MFGLKIRRTGKLGKIAMLSELSDAAEIDFETFFLIRDEKKMEKIFKRFDGTGTLFMYISAQTLETCWFFTEKVGGEATEDMKKEFGSAYYDNAMTRVLSKVNGKLVMKWKIGRGFVKRWKV